uniref:Uncharacterized protein n=1 Tax=Talaromyces marneffei PM1 TaxID=1077442 RepID=A0A093VKG1_TALMA
MADAMVEEPTTTRSGRVVTPSTRVREASGSDIISAVRTSKKSMTPVELTAVKKAAGLIEEKQSGKDGNRDMLKKIGQCLESTYQEIEKEMRGNEETQNWRCAAMVKDPKNADRIKLSKKDSNKAYGLMVVYITKGTDAKRLIDGNYFDIAGESAYTQIFELQMGPLRDITTAPARLQFRNAFRVEDHTNRLAKTVE